ncbi:MAG: YdcF family protein [Clostridia bacterium]|nr:YdcF family protein [Clostridia bacterium]
MPKAGKQIAVLAVLLLLFCGLCRLVFFNRYDVYVPLWPGEAEAYRQSGVQVSAERPAVAAPGDPEIRDRYLRIPVQPGDRGETELTIRMPDGGEGQMHVLRVGRFHTVYDEVTGNFTGDSAVLLAVSLFWLLVSALMLWHFLQARGAAFYSYTTIYYAGFGLFSLISGIVLTQVTAAHLLDPAYHSMQSACSTIAGVSGRFLLYTAPLILLFSLAMAVSNLVLLRHEGVRPQNALGLGVSLLLLAGEAVGLLLLGRDFAGSEWEYRVTETVENTYATLFVYFECMLAGAVICGIRAARYEPAPDKDFIVILGCWFRWDGTLPPLLQGRADRALAFWQQQKDRTGREAYFVPTGGRGADEPMPEAQAIRRYLLSRGIPDRLILPEERAANTLENMAFSRDIILAHEPQPRGKVVFATSGYHVFRSGVWAAMAGLPAEGIGSGTRWWFWPNAFMRETAGLLQKRWRQELLLLALLLCFFGLLSLTIT